MAKTTYQWHTIAETFEQICRGQTPWVAIGNFLNDWWFYAIDNRRELISTPLLPAANLEMQQWAAFCAAMVEWLCQQENLPFPLWTSKSGYILQQPWFYYDGLDLAILAACYNTCPF